MKKLSIFAIAAIAALSACAKDDAANGDSTAVVTDTAAMSTVPVAPMTPAATDTTMAPMTTDTAMGGMTDTTATDTTTKM
ncbi:MAG TPA: hypothetical protein VEX86_06540 [Longimicrobium sp.]|nr:hypothetical protein [Longimicrobium sp.]